MRVFRKITLSIALFIAVGFSFSSCGDAAQVSITDSAPDKETAIPQFEALTISVDQSNTNTLMLLLASDGTINRVGSLNDTTDHDFLIDITKEKLFDSVSAAITHELMEYCGKPSSKCDTSGENCFVELSFSSRKSECSVKYCVEGNFDQLPAPIKNFIETAQRITDPWHREQLSMITK